ncbi:MULTISPECIES: hypothetical protein [unclassified Lysobacter]|uniref:hypothetical protein n=1 Tax=unclassified Lysobacter TaxID=2635362 RepID=UPI001BE58D10|nr:MULTISPECIES: hypothetical protein [unclassified Lysobacter]MBT2747351.1 hypothetical protein [Lysobacter sp. ISL-42]MBT2753040.1 hypothetical protein [Lysobacter sp. ISL-50]MBT2776138.1 hypothetical protein [Lysobacter sp. ISL-54]MBT2784468.1 hypothetical protein [Lysobacter sp. ISL-52]
MREPTGSARSHPRAAAAPIATGTCTGHVCDACFAMLYKGRRSGENRVVSATERVRSGKLDASGGLPQDGAAATISRLSVAPMPA